MTRRLAFAIAAGLSLGGCCHDGLGYFASRSSTLAEFGPAPKPHHVKRAKAQNSSNPAVTSSKNISPSEDELSKLKPYSREWHAALDAINRAADDELKRKLVICRGCTAPDDQTGSLGPKRAAGGYLSPDEASRAVSLPLESTSSGGLARHGETSGGARPCIGPLMGDHAARIPE
jgi:hypothetical protein